MTTTAFDISPTGAYRAARDALLELRGRHADALATFTWPDVGERFNWAIDWFDTVARGNPAQPSSSSRRTVRRSR